MSNDATRADVRADNGVLRDVVDDDLPLFFGQQLDQEANQMAAFTPRDPTDRAAFMAHWARVRADGTITLQTIVSGGAVVGNIVCYSDFGAPKVGYWIGKAFWGRGIAPQALAAFLRQIETRPLYAHVARDNLASLRVLQKCGFVITGEDQEYSHARGHEVAEYILTEKGCSPPQAAGFQPMRLGALRLEPEVPASCNVTALVV